MEEMEAKRKKGKGGRARGLKHDRQAGASRRKKSLVGILV